MDKRRVGATAALAMMYTMMDEDMWGGKKKAVAKLKSNLCPNCKTEHFGKHLSCSPECYKELKAKHKR